MTDTTDTLLDALNEWQARYNWSRLNDPDHGMAGWNFFDAVEDSELIDLEHMDDYHAAEDPVVVLVNGDELAYDPSRAWWFAHRHYCNA